MVLMAQCSVLFFFFLILSSYVISERVNETFGLHTDLLECIDGLFLLPRTDGVICAFMRVYGQWERPLINLIVDVLYKYDIFDTEQPNIILDIGANIGTWSVPLSKLPNTIVHAFEPQRFILGHLRATLLANRIENVVPVYSVVGNSTGYMSINDYIPFSLSEEADQEGKHNFGAFSILTNLNPAIYRDTTYSRVRSVTLDHYRQTVLQGRCPVFMKLDIEFYELYAFVGGGQLIRECKPIIFFESHCGTLNRPMFLFLTSLDYDLYWVFVSHIDAKGLASYGLSFNFDYFKNHSEQKFNLELFAAPNVIALPRRKAIPQTPLTFSDSTSFPSSQSESAALRSFRTVLSHNIASLHNGTLFPIDIHQQQYSMEDIELRYCLGEDGGEPRCGTYYLHTRDEIEKELRENTHCNGVKVDEYLTNYYHHHSHLINKSDNKN